MQYQIKNYGLNVEATLGGLDSTHYLAGSTSKLGDSIIQADGNWTQYVPKFEPQYTNGYDTYGCTVFGTLNAVETLLKKIYGGEYDFSERYSYILAGIRPPGGDPHKVSEIIRSKGLLKQERLPLTKTYEEFIKPDPMTPALIDEAEKYLLDKQIEIGHEWIFTNNPNKKDRFDLLEYYLKRGTVCISVTAWSQDKNGLYIDEGQRNTHWVQLIRIDEINGVKHLVVADSYDLFLNGKSTAFIKTLHPDHHIEMAKRYAVTPKKPSLTPEQRNYFLYMIRKILEAIGLIQKEVDELKEKEAQRETPPPVVTTPFPTLQEKILKIAKESIGKDMSPSDNAPDELGCAESFCGVVNKAITFPTLLSTIELKRTLGADKRFKGTLDLEAGNVIISVTGEGKTGKIPNGHVGIIIEGGKIVSNSSNNGLWEQNYTIDSWVKRFRTTGGYPIYVYKPIG